MVPQLVEDSGVWNGSELKKTHSPPHLPSTKSNQKRLRWGQTVDGPSEEDERIDSKLLHSGSGALAPQTWC